MSTMRERFEKWAGREKLDLEKWSSGGAYDNLYTGHAWLAWQAAEKQYWPPKPDKLPDGYELAGDEPVDVRNVKSDDTWLGSQGEIDEGASWPSSCTPVMRWPIRPIAKPAPRMVPLGPDDIGEWVRQPDWVGAVRITGISQDGIFFYDFTNERRVKTWCKLQEQNWQHSHDRKTWMPCQKEATA